MTEKKSTDEPDFGQGDKELPKKVKTADDLMEGSRVAPLSADTLGTPDTQPDQPKDQLMEHQYTRHGMEDQDSQAYKDAQKALKEHEKLD